MGSGVVLKRAIEKYGIENYNKEYLYIFDNECEMNAKEKELVTEEFCLRKDTYNLCVGGHGGFSYINRNNLGNSNKNMLEIREKISRGNKGRPNPKNSERLVIMHQKGLVKYDTMTGKTMSKESREKISASAKKRMSNYNPFVGSKWYNNGMTEIKVYENETPPHGYVLGRVSIPKLSGSVKKCRECKNREDDIYWWNLFKTSGMNVSEFCSKVYKKKRQSFYGLVKRLGFNI